MKKILQKTIWVGDYRVNYDSISGGFLSFSKIENGKEIELNIIEHSKEFADVMKEIKSRFDMQDIEKPEFINVYFGD